MEIELKAYSNLQELLFDAYRRNLIACGGQSHDVVMCPLCLTPYKIGELRTGALTDEHIIARNLGGLLRHDKWQELRTLTCKKCNNQDGSTLDSHLIKMVREEDIHAGLSNESLDCRLEIDGHDIGGDLFLSAGDKPNIKIIGDKKRSNPKSQEATGRAIEAGLKNFKISIRVAFNALRCKAALLRVAYLLMFRHFGYNYILHKNAQMIREQIRNPDSDTIGSKAIVKLKEAPSSLYDVGLVYEPKELRCFFVKLDLSTDLDRFYGVVLPGLDEKAEDIYDRSAAYRETHREATFSTRDFVFNPDMPFSPTEAKVIESIWSNGSI